MPNRQPWLVFRFNHFDPIWRRCWDRDFEYAGKRFASYRTIEEAWITDAIESSRDGVSCFMVESSWVLRHYLERHPDHLETLRKLVAEGRFELLGSGENIIDTNMICGEMLARNMLLGTLWANETLGARSRVGFASDAFGASAQLPQILRQCGYPWIPDLGYQLPDTPFWRGLDGSTVLYSPDAGRGIILRLVERAGQAETVTIQIPTPWGQCTRCSLLEEPVAETRPGRVIVIDVHPWEIASVRVEYEGESISAR